LETFERDEELDGLRRLFEGVGFNLNAANLIPLPLKQKKVSNLNMVGNLIPLPLKEKRFPN
jgi:hypothetical protein